MERSDLKEKPDVTGFIKGFTKPELDAIKIHLAWKLSGTRRYNTPHCHDRLQKQGYCVILYNDLVLQVICPQR